MDLRKSAIFEFQLVKPILQTFTHLIQKTILGIQFWSVKCMTATVRYANISSISTAFLIKRKAIAMDRLYQNKPLQNTFKRI